MKKYILLAIAIIGIALMYSCKEDNNNDDNKINTIDISGAYKAIFRGRFSYNGNYYPYTQEMNVGITKINETQYYIVCYAGMTSNKAYLNIYDKNKIRGDFYLPWYASSWSKGTLDGVIGNNYIEGTFTGIKRGVDNITHEISEIPIEDGVFTMELIN